MRMVAPALNAGLDIGVELIGRSPLRNFETLTASLSGASRAEPGHRLRLDDRLDATSRVIKRSLRGWERLSAETCAVPGHRTDCDAIPFPMRSYCDALPQCAAIQQSI